MKVSLDFLHGIAYLVDGPAFPPRRSSDLRRPSGSTARGDGSLRPSVESALDRIAHELISLPQLKHREDRSEEHTSELQSPDQLVCRLLLEKKKTGKERGFEALGAARWRQQ